MVEAPTCYDILPTFLPEPGSLQEQMDLIYQQTDQEIREAAMDTGFSLNPLAKILGPIQFLLGEMNKGVRLVRRLWGWDDRLVTFQLLLLLVVANVLLTGAGLLLWYAPWGPIFEWAFRILGAALLGRTHAGAWLNPRLAPPFCPCSRILPLRFPCSQLTCTM